MVQDNSSLSIWDAWGGDWRDVWILDEDNVPYAAVNLTTYGLSNEDNIDAVKALFVGAAQGVPCADVQHGLDPSVCQ